MSDEMKLVEEIEEAAEKTRPPPVRSTTLLFRMWRQVDDYLFYFRDRVRNLTGKMIMGFQDEPPLYFRRSDLNNLIDELELEQRLAECTDNKSFNCVGKNGKMSSQPDINNLHGFNRNKNNQQVRMKIIQRISSFLIYIIVFLGISCIIWNSQLSIINVHPMHKEHSQLSIINVHPMHKEHNHRLSVWPPLLGLFGYLVFVCAVAAMTLVGAAFTTMQKAMIIFWAILMNLQLANSITEVLVTLVCGFFIECYMLSERKTTTK